jgi:hypothetical protein
MENYKRLFKLYKINFEYNIKLLDCGSEQYIFKTKDFNLEYVVNFHDTTNARLRNLTILEFLNDYAFELYYKQIKKKQAKEIVEKLDLKSKRLIEKYYR